jgi:flagellar motility protein MotE (MotC chaperone)
MKAADGVQIAGRPEAAIRSAARFALELAGKSKHCEAVADCAHCNLTFLATWAENMLTDLSRAEERERVLREEVKKANLWLAHRQQVIDNFFATLIPEQRTAAPEQGEEAKS